MNLFKRIKKTILPAVILSAFLSYAPMSAKQTTTLPQQDKIELKTSAIKKQESKKPDYKEVRGVFLYSWNTRNKDKLEELIDNMKQSNLNAVVVDIKSNAGEILYNTQNDLAKTIESKYSALGNLEKFIKKFHDENIYFIARHVVFNDPILAKKRPDLAIHNQNGEVWKGEMAKSYVPWADPNSAEVQKYNLDILEEVCKAGIDEIQFDYIRFPAHKNLVYSHQEPDTSKIQVLQKFLNDAWLIADKYDVKVGIDIFGFSIYNSGDLGIGHSFLDLLESIDVISPMLYPSHYTTGNFGFEKPQNHPYEVISSSVEKANKMAKEKNVVVRPWIQAFGWNTPTYSIEYIMDEIQAVYDGGSTSFLVWNANNNYDMLFKAIQKANMKFAPF
ncbi:MAG: putative glycoside hydrolase [Nanoarchaeota archaeon]|nr:putative glycoside hydrolase [Nanoarchaeota archaeon]MBU1321703.1 putative glycoside hydrolase [Nanoarchaeota archaeon]MBU1597283.1 putative glycoside hydrolase [Nanoarchaeota archaeon]MBU2442247.1 putative glycoside hydrolase [Nanoarchaeota archaeon]